MHILVPSLINTEHPKHSHSQNADRSFNEMGTDIIGSRRKFYVVGGGSSSIHVHIARNLCGHTHQIEVQISNVALEGTAAAWSKEWKMGTVLNFWGKFFFSNLGVAARKSGKSCWFVMSLGLDFGEQCPPFCCLWIFILISSTLSYYKISSALLKCSYSTT